MIAPDTSLNPALAMAAATLARATAFLGGGHGGPFGARVFANGLRELDRFLSLLIDEVAARSAPDACMGLARQRNTPNKLRGLRAALGLDSPDHERLRAIGRSRDRLFHSAAPRHGVDSVLVPAWLCGGAVEHGLGTPGIAAELRRICGLYDRLAAELLAACEPAVAGRTAGH